MPMPDLIRQKVRRTLTKVLLRVRRSVVFPLPFEEVYSAATGEQFAKVVRVRDHAPNTPQLQNLIAALSQRDLIHFTLDAPSTYWAHRMGGDDDPTTLFWLRAPYEVPGPMASRAYVLPDRLREDPRIKKWYADASSLGAEIDLFTTLIYEVASHIGNSTEFCMAWPEVANAVPEIAGGPRTVAGRQAGRIRSLRHTITKAFGKEQMERLTSLLASGILLPNQPLDAWVSEYSEQPFREEVP